jgi:hypothetical protein
MGNDRITACRHRQIDGQGWIVFEDVVDDERGRTIEETNYSRQGLIIADISHKRIALDHRRRAVSRDGRAESAGEVNVFAENVLGDRRRRPKG